MDKPKPPKDWCCVPQCKSDGRKRGKYAYISNIKFFLYISWTEKKPQVEKKLVLHMTVHSHLLT